MKSKKGEIRSLLIRPPITIFNSTGSWAATSPPLGLAYIAAVLENNRYEVRILDAEALGSQNMQEKGEFTRIGLDENEIRKYLEDYAPDILGVGTMFTAYAQDAHDVARLAKEVNPDTPVVFGGAHASACPDMVLSDKNVDMVVKGEGEITFLELVKNLEKGEDVFKTSGTIIRKPCGGLYYNPERPYISNLDSIPFPARHLLPMGIYFRYARMAGSRYSMRHSISEMITSRGCPMRCVFCSIHSVWGHSWRARSATNVVDEIEYLVSKYKVREIRFNDDNISLSKKRLMDICNEIIRRNLDIKWTTPNGIAIWTLNEALLKRMKESGCYRLTFGIESGNPETRRFIGKNFDLNKAKKIIKYANNIGLWTICTFILGFPYENMDSIKDTVKYAIDSDTDFALFYLLEPFLGTRVYEVFKNEGLLDDTQDLRYILSGIGGCNTKFFTGEELRKLQNNAYSKFIADRFRRFLNSGRVVKKIRSFEDLRYVAQLAKSAATMKLNQIRYGGITAKTLFGDQHVKVHKRPHRKA